MTRTMYAAARLIEEAPASTLSALAGVALAMWPEPMLEFLAYQRHAVLSGDIWRLWTAHLVHFSPAQALVNALILLTVGALAEPVIGVRRMLLALVLGAPLISFGLLWGAPGLVEYRGASGIAVMAAVIASAVMWREGGAWKTPITIAGCAFLVTTLAAAAIGTAAWQAHLLGVLCGAVFLALSWRPAIFSAVRQ